ncbi:MULTISPECIES: sigma-70 family RNA polymerase sigma factor [Marinobacterium]|nr:MULTISPECIES: sigma-70 family RNA polymerase sigma factor [Marinobacterium]TCK03678.1 RNA polymerase sigma-70 factor (ECF subfamily) [Marinobacterium mangrovicola]
MTTLTTEQRSAQEQIYRSHHGWLHAWLSRRVSCSELAADLAHDTFIRLLRKPRDLQTPGQARSYLKVVAENLCTDMWRRQAVEQAWLDVLSARPEATDISPEEHAVIVETFCEIDAMLQRLPERVGQAFLMSQLEGLTYRQIAMHLGVSERSVKSYMARAMLECVLIEANFNDAALC